MLSPQSQQVRDFVVSQYVKVPPETTIQQMRETMVTALANIPISEEIQTKEVSAGGVPADWIRMPGVSTDRVLLYLHGGAYTMGSHRTHRDLVSRLSQAAGVQVLIINYRLAPESPHPAAIEDALAAYHWLLTQGYKPEHIAIGGDSAGGGLTLATLLSLRDAGEKMPAAAILLSPWTDLTDSGESQITRAEADPAIKSGDEERHIVDYVGTAQRHHPLISPVFADLTGLPPLLIHVGHDEVLLDDSTRIAQNAQNAGVEVKLKVWEDMWHVFQAYAFMLPETHQSISELGAFVQQHLA